MSSRPHVVILGAGPAGLGAAYRLSERDCFDVTVLERQPVVGGNAGSFELAGFHVDYGSHRLHPTCDPEVLADIRRMLGADLLDRPRHGRIRLLGRWVRFPLKPLNLLRSAPPRFALGAARDALGKMFPAPTRESGTPTFSSVLREGLGPTICDDFYFPYVQKIWGLAPDEISPTLAHRRVQGNSITRMLMKILVSASPVKPAGRGRFFYPQRGYGQISQGYIDAAMRRGTTIHREAAVRSVQVADGRARSVEFEVDSVAQSMTADHIWSTIPMTTLVRAIRPDAPSEIHDAASRIRFRGMILVYLVLEQSRFTEYDAHYFPATDTSISRLSEPRNYSCVLEPRQSTVLCAELPCATDSSQWEMSDDELGELVKGDLGRNKISVTAPVTQVVTRRLPQAYPIYDLGYEQHLECMDRWLSQIGGLLTFGRQGLFAHDNTHHALLMAYKAAECLSDTGDFDMSHWTECRREFESHVVED